MQVLCLQTFFFIKEPDIFFVSMISLGEFDVDASYSSVSPVNPTTLFMGKMHGTFSFRTRAYPFLELYCQ